MPERCDYCDKPFTDDNRPVPIFAWSEGADVDALLGTTHEECWWEFLHGSKVSKHAWPGKPAKTGG